MSSNTMNNNSKPIAAKIQDGLQKAGEKIQEGAKYAYEAFNPPQPLPDWNCENWDSSKSQGTNFDHAAWKMRRAADAYNQAFHHPTGYDPVFDKNSVHFHSKHDHMAPHKAMAMGVH